MFFKCNMDSIFHSEEVSGCRQELFSATIPGCCGQVVSEAWSREEHSSPSGADPRERFLWGS